MPGFADWRLVVGYALILVVVVCLNSVASLALLSYVVCHAISGLPCLH